MSRANSQMRNFAERLIAYDTREDGSSGSKAPAAFSVCAKLRPHLATLMGNTGVRSLVLRALAVTREETGSLRAVKINADGLPEGFEALAVPADAQDLAKGSVILVAQLLALLVAFIGETLTLRLVLDVWPKLPLDDLDFDQRNEYEKPE